MDSSVGLLEGVVRTDVRAGYLGGLLRLGSVRPGKVRVC